MWQFCKLNFSSFSQFLLTWNIKAFLDRDDRNRVPSVTRWYDYLQFLCSGSDCFTKIEINTNYVEPKPIQKKLEEKKAPREKKTNEQTKQNTPNNNNNSQETKQKKDLFSKLDIRIGKIMEIDVHPSPEVDTLYVSKIDLGEKTPRTVVSGLRNFFKKEELLGSKVVVLCNLKPRPMRGITSEGMVLCASNGDHTQVELLKVNEETPIGDHVSCEGYEYKPEKVLVPKKKIWEDVMPDLKTNQNLQATYQGLILTTSKGDIKSNSIVGLIG